MKKMLARFSLLLLLACSAAQAQDRKGAAAGPCGGTTAHWDCPGALELRDDKLGSAARLLWFDNGELLGERQSGADKQSYLVLLPSRRVFYSNVPPLNLGIPATNPFNRYDRVFATALGALKSAFEAGPSSVPIGEKRNEVKLNGKPVLLTTWRKPGDLLVSFELSPEGEPVHRGHWDVRRPAPWEDKVSLEGWLNPRGEPAPATAGEGRKPQE
ncbi:hypothetical protein [Roseateles microcysteis]|uniref:hypothetical protein n=1 Tax=Roseateles microcysteis TaxID=3119057 RepID=UPI002FE55B0B